MADAHKALHTGKIGKESIPYQPAVGADLKITPVISGKPAITLAAVLEIKSAQIKITYYIVFVLRGEGKITAQVWLPLPPL
jgi:hypothetical protein